MRPMDRDKSFDQHQYGSISLFFHFFSDEFTSPKLTMKPNGEQKDSRAQSIRAACETEELPYPKLQTLHIVLELPVHG